MTDREPGSTAIILILVIVKCYMVLKGETLTSHCGYQPTCLLQLLSPVMTADPSLLQHAATSCGYSYIRVRGVETELCVNTRFLWVPFRGLFSGV